VRHELDGGQHVTLAPVVRVESYGALEHLGCFVELPELHQAGRICVQRVELRVKQRARLFKMNDRSRAVFLLV
jgi:hypothetical protein